MITVLLVIAWLTDGTPLPNFFVLPDGHPCSAEVAADYARRFIVPSLPEGYHIQGTETLLHICAPVPVGTPGPAIKPVLLQGQVEASN